jgi:hypothetical protein
MRAKKRRPIANDNIAPFQRTFLAEHNETLQSVLTGLLDNEAGPEHKGVRAPDTALDVEALK